MVDQTETFLRCTSQPLLFCSCSAADASTAAHRSLACAWLRVHARSLTTKIPSNPDRNLARAIDHQRRQEQHAMDSSLLAAMASAGDESPGGDGTMNGDGLRAPLETGVREPTPWFDRAIGGGGLRARTEPGETDPRTCRDRATGDATGRVVRRKRATGSCGRLRLRSGASTSCSTLYNT